MLSFLKDHPFAVEAFFEKSTVLTFAIPKEELENLIPECLELDTFDNKWAFIAIAMVQTKQLRPKGFPKFMGNDFFLIGYRVFVKYLDSRGKKLRGLYILKSETNKNKMQLLGNIFTYYNYSTTDINQIDSTTNTAISSTQSNFKVELQKNTDKVVLPSTSPFNDWKEARRFSGPLPFTFTYKPKTKEVLIIEGVRQNWKPKPINIIDYDFSFLNVLGIKNPVLASAFYIENISYQWKKGRIELWNKS